MFQHHKWIRLPLAVTVLALLAACVGAPPPPPPKSVEAPQPQVVERFRAPLGDGLLLDYQIERKRSKVNSTSCYTFMTGRIRNVSGKTLSKRSVLDVPVYAKGTLLFRDNTHPMADIPSGQHADFEMVVSPVFANGCPRFDPIMPVLRTVFL
jgi:hypothetical protein